MFNELDRVGVVTGGGRGIGRGIVLELASLRFSVVVNYRSDAGAALDEHLIARVDQLTDARRRQRNPVLVSLDLSGDPDSHGEETSSLPRNANQNSIRSLALLRLRPVSSSTRRIR